MGVGNMNFSYSLFLAAFAAAVSVVSGTPQEFEAGRLMSECDAACAVRTRITSGAVCGALRASYGGATYASFRGVPYAKQPVGKLRFLAPQPVEPWAGCFNATYEGPVCPQVDVLFPNMQPLNMGEDCLRINVHVPVASLPNPGSQCTDKCLPVLVYVHGGVFQFGSGDANLFGPEYMVDKDVVVVTFNYRLGPFGYLSLNTSSVPGNAGLRDMVAALRWIQDNIRAFGGDPGRVTLMGQSAGASAVHLLSISEAVTGLFSKVIMMSGTSGSGFYSTTRSYADSILTSFLKLLNITSTDTEEIHNQLTDLPYETLRDANSKVVDTQGLNSFNPVVELEFEGVTRILDNDPDLLVAQGRGSSYPILMGITNLECETLRRRFETLGLVSKIEKDPTAILPVKLVFSATQKQQAAAAEMKEMKEKYLKALTLDNYLPCCTDGFFIYPALKLAETRAATGGAPMYMYQFSYSSPYTPIKQALGLNYTGAAHYDDLYYVFRGNFAQEGALDSGDETVKDWMTNIVNNFIRYSNPTGLEGDELWPKVSQPTLKYQLINGAAYAVSDLTADQRALIDLFDSFYKV